MPTPDLNEKIARLEARLQHPGTWRRTMDYLEISYITRADVEVKLQILKAERAARIARGRPYVKRQQKVIGRREKLAWTILVGLCTIFGP